MCVWLIHHSRTVERRPDQATVWAGHVQNYWTCEYEKFVPSFTASKVTASWSTDSPSEWVSKLDKDSTRLKQTKIDWERERRTVTFYQPLPLGALLTLTTSLLLLLLRRRSNMATLTTLVVVVSLRRLYYSSVTHVPSTWRRTVSHTPATTTTNAASNIVETFHSPLARFYWVFFFVRVKFWYFLLTPMHVVWVFAADAYFICFSFDLSCFYYRISCWILNAREPRYCAECTRYTVVLWFVMNLFTEICNAQPAPVRVVYYNYFTISITVWHILQN